MPLAIQLGADLTKFDAAMGRAKETVVRHSGDMLSAFQNAGSGIERALTGALGSQALERGLPILLRYAPAIAAVTAGFAALAAIGVTASEQMARLHDIAIGAKAAGVSGAFWQTWANELEKIGIQAEEAGKALIKARTAVKPQATDTGQLADNKITDILGEQALGAGRLQAVYAQFKEGDVETRIKAVVQAIRDLNAAAGDNGDSRLNLLGDRLAELTFGSDKFAEAIRKAKTDFEALQAAGVANGTIFSSEIVQRAQELTLRLEDATRKLRDEMHPVMEGIAEIGVNIKNVFVVMVETLELVVSAIDRASTSSRSWFDELEKVTRLQFNNLGNADIFKRGLAAMQGAGLISGVEAITPPNALGMSFDPAAIRAGIEQSNRLHGAPIANPSSALPVPRPPPSVLADRGGVAKSAAAPADTFDQVDNYLKQLEKTVDVLKAQVSVLGLGNAERVKAVDLARAEAAARERGTALTDKERQKVLELAEAEAVARKALEDFQKAQRAVADATNYFGNQVIDVFDQMVFQGAKAEDVMRSLAQSIVKAALQAELLGSGPLAGLFGTTGQNGNVGGLLGALTKGLSGLFNGGGDSAIAGARAGGGPVSAGGAYLVGENGPEVVRMANDGVVIPNFALNSSAGGSAPISVVINNTSGAQIETRQQPGPDGRQQLRIEVAAAIADDWRTRGPIRKHFENRGVRG